MNVRGFIISGTSKQPLIESLVLAFEKDEIAVLDDAVLKGELMAYERKVSAITGRSQYSAPEGGHDDTVIALALAWYGVNRGGLSPEDIERWRTNTIDRTQVSPLLSGYLKEETS